MFRWEIPLTIQMILIGKVVRMRSATGFFFVCNGVDVDDDDEIYR